MALGKFVDGLEAIDAYFESFTLSSGKTPLTKHTKNISASSQAFRDAANVQLAGFIGEQRASKCALPSMTMANLDRRDAELSSPGFLKRVYSPRRSAHGEILRPMIANGGCVIACRQQALWRIRGCNWGVS